MMVLFLSFWIPLYLYIFCGLFYVNQWVISMWFSLEKDFHMTVGKYDAKGLLLRKYRYLDI